VKIQSIAALLLILGVAVPCFGAGLTLKECIQKAAAANPSLKVARYDEKIAEEGITLARSGYLPKIDIQGGYTVQNEPQSVKINGITAQTQQPNYAFANLFINQTLWDFGRTRQRFRRAELVRDASARSYSGQEKEIYLSVVETYYGILETRKLLAAADEEVMQRLDHLKIAQNLFEQGVVTRNDVLQAEVKLAESRQRRLATANNLENARLSLNFLIGESPGFRGDLDEKTEAVQIEDNEKLLSRAMENRPEISAARKFVEAGEAEVSENRSNYMPELYARAGVDYVENKYVVEQAIMSATVGLKMNLFDGLATTAKQRQAVKNLGKSREKLRLLEQGVRLELQTAINDSKVASERIRTVETAIKQGEENLRINRDRYQEQVGTATDVIDAQTLLTQIRSDYYRAVFDYEVAVARVKKALGEL